MMKPGNGEEKATRQCWECLKRRLVCDYTLPHCTKCQKRGKECPGYDEQKPLQWVELGSVTSRRKRKSPPKVQAVVKSSGPSRSSDECGSGSQEEKRRFVSEQSAELFQNAPKLEDIDEIFDIGDRQKIEDILARGLRDEARRMLKKEEDPLKSLEMMLRYMELEDLPRYHLSNETCEVVQAVQYFNNRIYPDIIIINDLTPNPHLIVFPLPALHLLPPSIHHIICCLAMNHFIYSLPAGESRAVASASWAKIYHHRGAALREMSEKIGKDKTRSSDATITSVLMFLCVELQQSMPTSWRTHAEGLMRLFDMRGGFMNLFRTSIHLQPTLVVFILVLVSANSTSPAGHQIILNASLDQDLANIGEIYKQVFPHCLCPPELWLEIIRINHLRGQAATSLLLLEDTAELCLTAAELLKRIDAFCPNDWAQPGAYQDEWLLIGSVYQSAIAIYCIMSLQSLTILPVTKDITDNLASHSHRLLSALKGAFVSKRLRRYITWPIVVAGVDAAYRGEATRKWLEEALSELSRVTGTCSPLRTRAILRRYWQREEPGWEECFNQSYAFLF